MKIERFEDIEGWKKGRELTRMIYTFVRRPEFSKDYGLKDQLTRASVSIMNNVWLKDMMEAVMPNSYDFSNMLSGRQLK